MSVTETPNAPAVEVARASKVRWTGLGHWNFYFLGKLLLFWGGYLQFDVYLNLLFAAALVFPLGTGLLNRVRHVVAIPVAIALLYHDTWYPPIERLLAQPEVFSFSVWYLIELLERLINWQLLGAGFIALVVYLYLYQWLRLTTLTVLILAGVGLSQYVSLPLWLTQPTVTTMAQAQLATTPTTGAANGASPVIVPGGATRPMATGKPTDAILNQTLENFYQAEKPRKVEFPAKAEGPPFDILVISICSLAWADLEEVGLTMHPLFKNVNVVFDNFSTSTSYSGPAVLRLLRANCGQTPHADIYKPGDESCYLFQTLNGLGYQSATVFNHESDFQGFFEEVRVNGKLPPPQIPKDKKPMLTGFDGNPIWDDFNTLNDWWQRRLKSDAERTALFYNTITLHDGNREATADGGGRTAPFVTRAQRMLDELNEFLVQLEKSGRRVMVIFIPEHGASLKSDRMQIAGMREIPTFDITHVPVGVRLVGTADKSPVSPVQVKEPTSYLALSALISRILGADVFEQPKIDWDALTADLPQTAPVSENEGTIVMQYQGTPFVRMGGKTWIEYPK